MYIRKAIRKTARRQYTCHLLVASESTPQGPRQKTVCSLGSLSPGPRKKWLALARKLLAALEGDPGGESGGPHTGGIRAATGEGGPAVGGTGAGTKPPGGITVHPPGEGTVKPGVPGEDTGPPVIDPEQIRAERALEAGPVRAGHAVWARLGLDTILGKAGLPPRAVKLAEMITLNLLTATKPGAPLARWARQTVLPGILGEAPGALAAPAPYRQLDRLSSKRGAVEQALAAAEQRLFGTGNRGLVFDLRGVSFEAAGGSGPAARGGAAAQARTDGPPLTAGLVLDRMGFARAHEPLSPAGKAPPELAAALRLLGRRSGMTTGAVVALDRKEATPANLALVRKLGHRSLASGDEADGIGRRLAGHDERMALLSGPAAGTSLLEQLPLAPESRIFLQLIACRLLNATEQLLHRGGVERPWYAVREELRRHQAVALSVPHGDGTSLSLERETRPGAEQESVYEALGVVVA